MITSERKKIDSYLICLLFLMNIFFENNKKEMQNDVLRKY